MSLLEESWEEREEKLYRDLLGDTGPGIFPLSNGISDRMNAKSIDPRWLTHGVFRSPPSPQRETWAYITSGMSNPWEADEPDEYSGLGIEFIMETVNEETWAIEVLQTLMAYNLMITAGQIGDLPPLDAGHRVPLALSENITTMMFIQPAEFPSHFSIKSGRVDLLQVVGITEIESVAAKQTSPAAIKEKLIAHTGGLVTSKERESVA